MISSITEASKITQSYRAYSVVVLLFLFQMLNFFDKVVLGLSAVPLMHDLSISPKQFGLLGSSFFLLFSLSGIFVGVFLIGRVQAKWVLAALAMLWTISQVSASLTNSFAALLASRILLGLGEGPGLPSALHVCYDWFPANRRSVPSAIVLQGISFGLLVGSPFLTYVISRHGWHAAFSLCGILSLVWTAIWLLVGAEGPLSGARQDGPTRNDAKLPTVPNRSLWLDRTVIGVMIMSTMSYWVTGMAGTWLAPYLQLGLGYTARQTGWIISGVYLFQSPLLLVGAWLTQRGLRSGLSRRVCLGWSATVALLASGLALAAGTRLHGPARICLIGVAFAAPSLTTIFGPVALAAIAPAVQRGKLVVVIYSANAASGLVSNAVVGLLVGSVREHMVAGFSNAMLLTAMVLLVGAVSAFILMDPDKSIRRFGSIALPHV